MASGLISRNVPYIWSQVLVASSSCSAFVKILNSLLVTGYLVSWYYGPNLLHYVGVLPSEIMPPNFAVWTLLSHCFFEDSVLMLLEDVVAITLYNKLVEPLWGNVEVILFFFVMNVSTAFVSVVYLITLYWLTGRAVLLFSVAVHGLAGYIAAILVAVKQLMPDHVLVALPRVGKLRNRNLPFSGLLTTLLLWLVGLLRPVYPVMFFSGSLSAWVYLRFWQAHPNGSRGDPADHFSFAYFFPNVLQPPVATVCNTVFDALVRARLARRAIRKPFNNTQGLHVNRAIGSPGISIQMPASTFPTTATLPMVPSSGGHIPHGQTLGTVSSEDAERRKQVALKALYERLGRGKTREQVPPTDPQISQGVKANAEIPTTSSERLLDL